ncbi:MAG TPA: hypothetical protein VFO85_21880, partial [Vicinamibacteria bacterium]|nr:hypothetical protein [Vicinamibacteria bacterium]
MRPALQPPPDALGDLRQRLDALAGEVDDLRQRLDALSTPHLVAAPAPALEAAAAVSRDRDLLPLL